MPDWLDGLRADPTPWLLDASAPAVRHLALRQLLGLPDGDPEVLDARAAATRAEPITSILAAMDPAGWWVKLGPGYLPKEVCEAGAGGDPRIRRALDWILAQQDELGRWTNRYAYAGKMINDIDVPGQPSRWVTLRACRVLKAVAERRLVPAAS